MSLSIALAPFSFAYRMAVGVRNALYDRGVFRSYDLGARTISIGNITAGGTGKTPLVAYVAETLAEQGESVCILTRGYGRRSPRERVLVSDKASAVADAGTGGDEPVELAKKLLGKAIVIADADRVSAAEWALERFEITAFVLDDAFQHRRARRDLDIVCIDATDPFGGGWMLPVGRLREPLTGLSRAGVIMLTRSDLVESTEQTVESIRKHNADAPIFTVSNKITAISPHGSIQNEDGSDSSIETSFRGNRFFAFCAIGNPGSFRRQLEIEQIEIGGFKAFRDHHRLTVSDIKNLEQLASKTGAEAFLTTAKDAVKLENNAFSLPVFVVETIPNISNSADFERLITASFSEDPS
jgi:tetraacyldisaccharide 4'-kinase